MQSGIALLYIGMLSLKSVPFSQCASARLDAVSIYAIAETVLYFIIISFANNCLTFFIIVSSFSLYVYYKIIRVIQYYLFVLKIKKKKTVNGLNFMRVEKDLKYCEEERYQITAADSSVCEQKENLQEPEL
jgi:hypothetical protein